MAKKLVHLVFPQQLIKEPVIWKLAKDFEVITNIRKASVTKDFGWIDLELEGEDSELEKALKDLESKGIQVTPIERDVVE